MTCAEFFFPSDEFDISEIFLFSTAEEFHISEIFIFSTAEEFDISEIFIFSTTEPQNPRHMKNNNSKTCAEIFFPLMLNFT